MGLTRIKSFLARFRDDTRGTIMVESVLTLPLLFWIMTATFEFFEVHRYKSIREKATYTVADMLSREQDVVTETYIDNAKILFDEIAHDDGTNQIRISIIQYAEDDDEFSVSWSKVRGTGPLAVLTDGQVADDHDRLPMMNDGEQIIVVESVSTYEPLFVNAGLGSGVSIEARVFTSIRFAPQLTFES